MNRVDFSSLTMTEKITAALRDAAKQAVERAELTGTNVIVWRDGKVVRLTAAEAKAELNLHDESKCSQLTAIKKNEQRGSMKKDFRELIVWQKAMEMVTEIYRATQAFPSEERYGLTSQLRRAAVSVPSNIAEGQGRLTKGEFRQFLGNAKGSLAEVETQLIIARNLGYLVDPQPLLEQLSEVARLLNGLLRSLTTDN